MSATNAGKTVILASTLILLGAVPARSGTIVSTFDIYDTDQGLIWAEMDGVPVAVAADDHIHFTFAPGMNWTGRSYSVDLLEPGSNQLSDRLLVTFNGTQWDVDFDSRDPIQIPKGNHDMGSRPETDELRLLPMVLD